MPKPVIALARRHPSDETQRRRAPLAPPLGLALALVSLFGGACVDERSRARPVEILLTPNDDARAEIEWRFDYDGARVSGIERRENGDFAVERRFDYDADGFLKELTIENRTDELILEVTTDEGLVVRVSGDAETTNGSVTSKASLTIELDLDDERRASRLVTDSFYETVDDAIPFAIQRTTVTSSEDLEFAFDDQGRIEGLAGDRVATTESAIGSLEGSVTTTTDIAVELRYDDDGLSRVKREEAATTDGTTTESTTEIRLTYDQRIVEIEESMSAGDVNKDWEIAVDSQGRIIEIVNDDETIEISYAGGDEGELEGPTVALPYVSFGEYFDLAGKAFTRDYRLDHLLLP